MKIVAIDFSCSPRTVAALNEDALAEVVEHDPRNTVVLTMIAQALERVRLDRTAVECIAVGLGPGSYTGIRASIAMAQGWQLATGAKLLGISSAETIAAQAAQDGIRGRVSVVIDAQRGEFYLSEFELSEMAVAEVSPLRIVSLEQVKQGVATSPVIGPEVRRWFPDGSVILPRAETLARLAERRTDFLSGDRLEPIYLRETTFVKAPPPRIIPAV